MWKEPSQRKRVWEEPTRHWQHLCHTHAHIRVHGPFCKIQGSKDPIPSYPWVTLQMSRRTKGKQSQATPGREGSGPVGSSQQLFRASCFPFPWLIFRASSPVATPSWTC